MRICGEKGEPVVAVYATQPERQQLLGFAAGDLQDIQAFFDDRKAYGLEIRRLQYIRVPTGFAQRKKELERRKTELLQELEEIKSELKGEQPC